MEVIASALGQGPVRPELIVVDDASSDDTPELVAAAFPQVRLLRQSINSGFGPHGRNIGLQAARCRYVKFLDHDDLLESGSLALEEQAAEQHRADMVIARWGDGRVGGGGRLIEASRRIFIPPDPHRLIEAILLGEKVPYTAGVLYRRSFIAEQRWDERLTINDDFDWFCRNALRTDRIVRLEQVSYYWRLHTSSIQRSQKLNPQAFVESVYIHNHIYRGIANMPSDQQKLAPSYRRLLVRQLYRDLCVVRARFNFARCRQTLRCISTLQPGFKPDAGLAPSRWLRLASGWLGIKRIMQLYRWLLFLPDQIRFRGDSIRFFEA